MREVMVKDMFKKKSSFYVKTLAVYGAVLALLYCTNMQHEQKYNESEQLDVVDKCALGTAGNIAEQGSGYPYARMMNLIAQSRSVEHDFHRYTVDFNRHRDERVDDIKMLHQKIKKLSEKLKQERGTFVDHVSVSRFKGDEEQRPENLLCSKGKCRYSRARHSALSRKARNQKSARYTCQVINEYIERLEIMSLNLGRLIENERMRDEAAKARSENQAKIIAGEFPESPRAPTQERAMQDIEMPDENNRVGS